VFDPDARLTVSRNYELSYASPPESSQIRPSKIGAERFTRPCRKQISSREQRERERERESFLELDRSDGECQGPIWRILLLPIFSRSRRSRPVSRVLSDRVQSRNSLEIRDSRHKSTVIRAPACVAQYPADLTYCANSVGFGPIKIDGRNPRDRYCRRTVTIARARQRPVFDRSDQRHTPQHRETKRMKTAGTSLSPPTPPWQETRNYRESSTCRTLRQMRCN